jgi:hypothetical protein
MHLIYILKLSLKTGQPSEEGFTALFCDILCIRLAALVMTPPSLFMTTFLLTSKLRSKRLKMRSAITWHA